MAKVEAVGGGAEEHLRVWHRVVVERGVGPSRHLLPRHDSPRQEVRLRGPRHSTAHSSQEHDGWVTLAHAVAIWRLEALVRSVVAPIPHVRRPRTVGSVIVVICQWLLGSRLEGFGRASIERFLATGVLVEMLRRGVDQECLFFPRRRPLEVAFFFPLVTGSFKEGRISAELAPPSSVRGAGSSNVILSRGWSRGSCRELVPGGSSGGSMVLLHRRPPFKKALKFESLMISFQDLWTPAAPSAPSRMRGARFSECSSRKAALKFLSLMVSFQDLCTTAAPATPSSRRAARSSNESSECPFRESSRESGSDVDWFLPRRPPPEVFLCFLGSAFPAG